MSLMSYLRARYQRRRLTRRWEKGWGDPAFAPTWYRDEARSAPLVEAVSSGWFPSGSTVLDVGCGRGENAAWLASQGYLVTGIDVSQAALSHAETSHLTRHQNLRFQRVDVAVPTKLGTFDIITDIGCFHCLPPALHPYYAANILSWSHQGTRMIIRSHTLKVSANQQQQLIEALLTPVFGIESVEVTPNPKHSGSFRMLMRLERRS